jgi:hypothetical protein
MISKAAFAQRARRATALGVAGLGACAVLAACAPAKIGAAAIVGNQRITLATLDGQVANLQAAAKPYGSGLQLKSAQMPDAVLSLLVQFGIVDQIAATHGISVSKAQIQAAITSVDSQAASYAAQSGSTAAEVFLNSGISPQMMNAFGRYEAQVTAYAEQLNGGKLPTTTAQGNTVNAAITKSECVAAKTLNIQISPQFGRPDYGQTFSIVAADNTLSNLGGAQSTAPATGLTPPC